MRVKRSKDYRFTDWLIRVCAAARRDEIVNNPRRDKTVTVQWQDGDGYVINNKQGVPRARP